MQKKKILVLGGGYAGLECTLRLEKLLRDDEAEVTLISKHDYHYQSTLLHRVALGTYSARKARIFYRKILKKALFIKDTITKIDINEKKVNGNIGCYEYDYLVISLGFEPNYFGIEGANKHTFALATINWATKMRDELEAKFKDFDGRKDPNDLSFVVVGSGFTGVEFASELGDRAKELCEICGIAPSLVKITLVSRGEQILPMFSPALSAKARTKITKKGVDIVRGEVIKCESDGVIIRTDEGEKKIEANTTLWSAGVKGSSIISASGIESKNDRVLVEPDLRMPGQENVFVLGDCASAKKRDIIHAPTAQLACQMGAHAAKSLVALLRGNKTKEFNFNHKGTVCSIGHTDAVGFAFGVGIAGEVAAFLKNFIENKWLYFIGGLSLVIKKGQFRFRSSD